MCYINISIFLFVIYSFIITMGKPSEMILHALDNLQIGYPSD